ncbi:lipocalin-like domain-containing protein (plasmid) [Methylobacterium sp. NMS12]|uniref:lipocalin-like domain-containing protein n=1 Tax=Methylobacterium sp. NMS12 TaxID=3079766 RepID=UPI003F880993
MPLRANSAILLVAGSLMTHPAAAQPNAPNQVVGTWRMVEARIYPEGKNLPAYGARANGLLVFTPDMHYVEVLLDADVPRFASDARGQGTDAENRAAMAGSIGQFGTYTVDGTGAFSGDRVEGATFPNWTGDVRTSKELRIVVDGDRMVENFQRPDGTRIAITYRRVR